MKRFLSVLALLPFLTLLLVSCPGDRPVTITMLVLGNRPTNGRADAAIARINEITSERIGAVLRLRYIEWANWQTGYQLALARGDRNIDLVIASTTWLYGWELVRRGAFYPMTPEMLQRYAPITWASIPPEHWDVVTYNGSIWFIPENNYTQFTNHGMFWRQDWARKAGIESIDTFEDLERYFDAVLELFDGTVVPWDVAGATYLDMSLFAGFLHGRRPVQGILGVAIGNASIFQYNIYDPYTVISYFMYGDYLTEAAIMFQRWSDKGFWRRDVLNHRGETRNMFLAGLSGADQHHTHTFLNLREQMDREQPGSEIQMFYWGKEIRNVNRDLITHAAMAINGASRNVGLALQMYDLLRNDREIYTLLNHGIEGIDYIVLPDGRFSRPEGFNVMTDSLGTNFWGGRMDEFEPVWDTFWEGRQDFIDYLSSFARPYPLEKFAFDNTAVAAEMAAMGDVAIRHLPRLHFGQTGDPVAAVELFREEMRRSGYYRVKAEIQRQLDLIRP